LKETSQTIFREIVIMQLCNTRNPYALSTTHTVA